MKLSTILIGTLAAFATAAAVPFTHESTVERGLDLNYPGAKPINDMLMCIKEDMSWKADYSKATQGIVTFSSVTPKCCNLAQSSWSKYEKDWSKFAVATFNDPCDGGQLGGMTPRNAMMLEAVIGSGH